MRALRRKAENGVGGDLGDGARRWRRRADVQRWRAEAELENRLRLFRVSVGSGGFLWPLFIETALPPCNASWRLYFCLFYRLRLCAGWALRWWPTVGGATHCPRRMLAPSAVPESVGSATMAAGDENW